MVDLDCVMAVIYVLCYLRNVPKQEGHNFVSE